MTDADVANMALDVLDEARITALTDDNKAARLLNRHYVQTRKAELAKHPWNFAITSFTVTGADTGSGEGTLNWEYTLPVGVLRVLPLTYNGDPLGVPISWRQQKEGTILTDQESPRIIRAVVDVTDPDDWHPLFVEVVVAALAVKIALPLTQKAGMVDMARGAYQEAVAVATQANAFDAGGTLYRQSWAQERGDGRYWRA